MKQLGRMKDGHGKLLKVEIIGRDRIRIILLWRLCYCKNRSS
jgi:hypothetical protein